MMAAAGAHVGPGAAPRAGLGEPGPVGATGRPPRRTPPRPLEVYVVEDNVIVLESLIAALEELAPVHVAGTAADEDVAVQALQPGGIACDLVIVDIFLRSGSGLGVIAAARRRRPDMPVVVLSNYATDEMRARCLAAGADRVFDKSREIDLLVGFCTALSEGGERGGPAPH
jgi:DNA-binding NarL/FixJ family response regulator